MSLMKLAPESVRLRRLAKAYAAGEIAEAEYRQARRQVIDSFSAQAPADDDTRRRADDDTSRRGEEELTLRSRVGGAIGSREADDADAGPRRWRWLLGLVLVAACVLVALPEARGTTGLVPAVRERDPDPIRSPRLEVAAVQVVLAAGEPDDVVVDLDALQSRADAALAAARARVLPGPHGFTEAELSEVGRLLNVLGVHGEGSTLDAADARDLATLIREQKTRRGVSVAELEAVARAVQEALRQQGYFLGVAYLPAQSVAQGQVRIDVLPGRLGEVVAEGPAAAAAMSAFASLRGQALTLADVSGRLEALNALPGVTAQASFGPGAAIGETRLRLDLLEQRRWAAAVSVDNHGDAATGDQRLAATASWLSPRGVSDRLTAGLLASMNPANQTWGYLDYDMPLGAYRVAGRVGSNDFNHDGTPGFDGDGLFFDLSARRRLSRAEDADITLVVNAAHQTLDWDGAGEQTVLLAGLGVVGQRVWQQPRLAADAALAASVGRLDDMGFLNQEDSFWLLELDSTAWLPLTLPGLPGEQKLELRLEGQWADARLPATRRFALGGAARARGFDRSAFLADRSLLVSVGLRQPLPLGELVVFAERGYGEDLARPDLDWVRVGDLGLGWEAELLPGVSSRLSWAVGDASDDSGGIDDDGSRFYWSLRYDH